jgi:hypothetical protein
MNAISRQSSLGKISSRTGGHLMLRKESIPPMPKTEFEEWLRKVLRMAEQARLKVDALVKPPKQCEKKG